MAELNLWVEVIPKGGYYSRQVIGKVYKRRPPEHAGRLVHLTLNTPYDFLREYDVTATIEVPATPPVTIEAEGVPE